MSTEHNAAHDEALQRIRQAQQSGTEELCLTDLALEHLPAELGKLTGLTTLLIDGCSALKDIASLRGCTRLAVLDLRACPRVIDLSPLRGLYALRELRLGVRDRIFALGSKEPLSSLSDIDVLNSIPKFLGLDAKAVLCCCWICPLPCSPISQAWRRL